MDDISQASERQESRVYNHQDGTPTIEGNTKLLSASALTGSDVVVVVVVGDDVV